MEKLRLPQLIAGPDDSVEVFAAEGEIEDGLDAEVRVLEDELEHLVGQVLDRHFLGRLFRQPVPRRARTRLLLLIIVRLLL